MIYPKVNIIILNWNGKMDTIECINSLQRINYSNYKLLIVDNGSSDGSVEYFKKIYPYIELIENNTNLGFAEGNNIGITRALSQSTDYILLLNNDTVVAPNFLDELIKVAEKNPQIGIVGPTVYHYGKLNKIQFAGAKISLNTGRIKLYRLNETDDGQFDELLDVDYVCGCALLGKKELFEKIGSLNKYYFAYWEETEWCFRALKAGYKVVYAPKSKIWHKGGASSTKISGFSQYHMTRNMFWFMKKHATTKQYLLFMVYFFGFRFWFSVFAHIFYYRNLKGFNSFIKGVIDGIKTYH